MKNLMKIVAIGLFSIVGCKKDGKDAYDVSTQSKFSYSSFVIDKNAEVTSEVTQNHLTFTFTKPGMEVNLPSLVVQVYNFKGPGTYDSKDGVTVYALEKNDETYWQHNYYNEDPAVRSRAKVVIKRADEYLTAEIEGELVHEELAGNDMVRTYTPFKGTTHQTLYRR
jgi:hypothetical protein